MCTHPDGVHAYTLSEEQHTALYKARHLLEVLQNLASIPAPMVEVRQESLAVTLGIASDLLDESQGNLIRRTTP